MAQIEKKPTTKAKVAVKKTVTKTEAKDTQPVAVIQEKVLVKYNDKNIKISPRKLRLLANNIKKLSVSEALNNIRFVNSKSARVLVKALHNVITTAKNNYGLDENSLKFSQILVNEGMKIKRMDKGHGARFARGLVMKRHSKLNIVVTGVKK